MPRYFFNVYDGEAFEDLQGTVMPDLNAARKEAVRFSGELLAQGPGKFWSEKGWHMDVRDEYGLLLFTLNFSAQEMPSVVSVPFIETLD